MFSPPPAAAGDHQYFSYQLPPLPADVATVGLEHAPLHQFGDLDLLAFDNADEHKAPHHDCNTLIVPEAQNAVVVQDYAGVDAVDGVDQEPMVMAGHYFLPASNNAFESAVPSRALPRPALRGRMRSLDHRRSTPAPEGKTRLDHIGLDELKRYFYMPITRAAREMNVGLTVLKKRCRELGIPWWPYRKMKSLKSLILDLQVTHNFLCTNKYGWTQNAENEPHDRLA
jgi:hypothetical protein